MSREKSGGISVTTLLIASASAATAAVVVPLLWEGGGVVAAAITPVIVTLVSESLKHPVTKVQEVGVWRKTPQGTAVRQPAGRDFDPLDPQEERLEVDPERTDDPFGLREPDRGGSGFFTKRKVVIALITGAIAFGIAAVVVTAGELTIGGSSGGGQEQHDVLRRQEHGHADADRHADAHAGGRRDADAHGHADRDAEHAGDDADADADASRQARPPRPPARRRRAAQARLPTP